jgi:hypothetical protein
MDNEIALEKKQSKTKDNSLIQKDIFWKGLALFLFAVIILTQLFEFSITPKLNILKNTFSKNNVVLSPTENTTSDIDVATITQKVLPEEGVRLPMTWGSLGKQMIDDGVIDETKFRALFEGGLSEKDEQILTGSVDEQIVMTQENSRFMLDMLWAFGLANKNDILENGEMTDQKYGGDPSKFAATGGWSLAKGPGPDHYSMHSYVTLSPEEQALVDEVSKNIYRPCCGNSTHFPDCNHGMALLGLLELMAKNGVTEKEMYSVALDVNALWFPQTYIDLATYFKEQGTDWDQVDPKLALGSEYSSSQGYQQTRQKIQSLPKPQQGGGGCGA